MSIDTDRKSQDCDVEEQEEAAMRRIIRACMEDISSEEVFQFSLRCAVCGSLWKSQPVRFSKAGMQPESEGKRVIFQTLYQREREEACKRATTEALEYFSLCPICKRLVCDHCFLMGEDIDLCMDCAAFLQERGEPVADVSAKNA